MLRLNTFTISHFSEKARWALDYNAIGYEERLLLPGPHMLVIRRLAPKTTVPVLEHDGRVVQGSAAILDYLEERLGADKLMPAPEQRARTRELEALADHAFGLGTQTIFYEVLLGNPKSVVDLWTQGGPGWGRVFYGVAFPLLAKRVSRKYKTQPKNVAAAKDRFRNALDVMDAALEKAPYLLGDRPSRLDVSVASLLAPMCRPPEHVLRWPDLPPRLEEFVAPFRRRPIFEHVLKMYRQHRRQAAS